MWPAAASSWGQQAGGVAPPVYNIDGVPEPAFVVDNSPNWEELD